MVRLAPRSLRLCASARSSSSNTWRRLAVSAAPVSRRENHCCGGQRSTGSNCFSASRRRTMSRMIALGARPARARTSAKMLGSASAHRLAVARCLARGIVLRIPTQRHNVSMCRQIQQNPSSLPPPRTDTVSTPLRPRREREEYVSRYVCLVYMYLREFLIVPSRAGRSAHATF